MSKIGFLLNIWKIRKINPYKVGTNDNWECFTLVSTSIANNCNSTDWSHLHIHSGVYIIVHC